MAEIWRNRSPRLTRALSTASSDMSSDHELTPKPKATGTTILPSVLYPSPPEDTIDSFPKEADFQQEQEQRQPQTPTEEWDNELPPLRSPSRSPANPSLPSVHDPQLFPTTATSHAKTPLFDDQCNTPRRPQKNHGITEPANYSNFDPKNPIFTRDTAFSAYRFVCSEVARIPGNFSKERREMERMESSRRPAGAERPLTIPTLRTTPTTPTSPKQPLDRTTGGRVKKPRVASSKPKVAKVPEVATPPPSRRHRTPAATKSQERSSESLEPNQTRKRAPPSKPTTTVNWQELADYAPSTSTLDSADIKLKVTWKGNPNSLVGDPDVGNLHYQEVTIAQDLKLPAAQYLANKRRIFEARLNSLRDGKTFTKTAAQTACNIDVNKTSQLYEAFQRVGWFEKEHFQKWL